MQVGMFPLILTVLKLDTVLNPTKAKTHGIFVFLNLKP